MRDINRIDPICELLKTAWKKCPDMRLGQLMVDVLGDDPFYVEDDIAEKSLEAFIKYAKNY